MQDFAKLNFFLNFIESCDLMLFHNIELFLTATFVSLLAFNCPRSLHQHTSLSFDTKTIKMQSKQNMALSMYEKIVMFFFKKMYVISDMFC